MFLLEKKEKNRFLLSLHRDLYPEDVLAKALKEDKSWVSKKKTRSPYQILEFKTEDETDVLDWANYLLYLRKKRQHA